jgi:hypothetical protein
MKLCSALRTALQAGVPFEDLSGSKTDERYLAPIRGKKTDPSLLDSGT